MNIKCLIAAGFALACNLSHGLELNEFYSGPFPVEEYGGPTPYPIAGFSEEGAVLAPCCEIENFWMDWTILQSIVIPENNIKLKQIGVAVLGDGGPILLNGKKLNLSGLNIVTDWGVAFYNIDLPVLAKGAVINIEFLSPASGGTHIATGIAAYEGGSAVQKLVTFDNGRTTERLWELSGPVAFYAKFEKISPVPEPTTISMLFAGIAISAAALAKRKVPGALTTKFSNLIL